ncbi:Serine/threonine-protein kinase env7 [Dispira simplex]|nr:Serine/threonine-protein kinase env7 [Dispira simplex]
MNLFQDFVNSVADITRTAVSQCFPSSPEVLQLNSKTYKVLTRLGEGGFSMVYLVRDLTSQEALAVKKVRCAAGTDGYTWAMREVDMYRRFRHDSIIQLHDVSVIQGMDGAGSSLIGESGGNRGRSRTAGAGGVDQTVYMFLPYYRRGNLQDWLQRELLETGEAMAEDKLLLLFREICIAVRAMHEYELKDELPSLNIGAGSSPSSGDTASSLAEYEYLQRSDGARIVPYAHRDIKPANVMLKDDGVTPVLMDLGSARRARVYIKNRQQALLEQDDAAEHCSMPYRAPELFDVQTDVLLDERVDIWSLGATLYAVAYGESPFETQMNEQGGSIALAVINGKYSFPSSDPYSPKVRQLIQMMLVTDPSQRPYIHQVLDAIDQQS